MSGPHEGLLPIPPRFEFRMNSERELAALSEHVEKSGSSAHPFGAHGTLGAIPVVLDESAPEGTIQFCENGEVRKEVVIR